MSDAHNKSLAGKVAIITGAGGGLGGAMARALSAIGAAIAGVDVNNDGLQRLGVELGKSGGKFLPIVADITSPAQAKAAVDQALSGLGSVDILINNAGLGGWQARPAGATGANYRFWESSIEPYQKIVRVNFLGAFLMAHAAAQPMMAKKWGRIINVTTSLDTMLRGNSGPYGPAKAALEASSAAWAEDLADTGVTVNVLVPGGTVDTGLRPPGAPAKPGILQPEIMMAPVAWLASPRSDGYTACRFVADEWDVSAPPNEAAEKNKSPVAWRSLAAEITRGRQGRLAKRTAPV